MRSIICCRPPPSRPRPDMPSGRILAVDDHPVNLKLIRVLLAAEGYEVRTAADADELSFS